MSQDGVISTITLYAPSPDNRILVYARSRGGSEKAVLHFLDIATGKAIPDTIDRARQAVPSWSRDGSSSSTPRWGDRIGGGRAAHG